jgi:type VI secretion system protein ImpK
MTPGRPEARGGAHHASGPRAGRLALALQEALTAIVRVRGNRRDVAEPEAFRQQFKQVLAAAHEEARRGGYASDDVRLAVYAAVVLLDESVLQSRQAAFVEWARRPLQEELFGGHVGGEAFFENLRGVLARDDSEVAADVAEVYLLCLLLGFRGRYAGAGDAERQQWMSAAAQRIARARGTGNALCPFWAPPQKERIRAPADPWILRLALAAAVTMIVALVLFVAFDLSLGGAVDTVRALAAGSP